jgi:hypothetical protein
LAEIDLYINIVLIATPVNIFFYFFLTADPATGLRTIVRLQDKKEAGLSPSFNSSLLKMV